MCAPPTKVTEVVVLLLAHPDIDVNQKMKDDATPLFLATNKGHTDIVKLLLDKGADPKPATDGPTPLELATKQGRTEIVDMLLNAGANKDL